MDVKRAFVAHRQALARYLIVGVGSFLGDYGVLALAYHVFHAPLWLATSLGFWTIFGINFVLSRHWTFEATNHATSSQLLRYAILVAVNYGVTVAAVWLLHYAGAPLFVAKGITVAVLTVTTFLAYRLWVFPSTAPQEERPSQFEGPPRMGPS